MATVSTQISSLTGLVPVTCGTTSSTTQTLAENVCFTDTNTIRKGETVQAMLEALDCSISNIVLSPVTEYLATALAWTGTQCYQDVEIKGNLSITGTIQGVDVTTFQNGGTGTGTTTTTTLQQGSTIYDTANNFVYSVYDLGANTYEVERYNTVSGAVTSTGTLGGVAPTTLVQVSSLTYV